MNQYLEALRKSHIWLALIVSMFLCGMCVEKVYADSSLCLNASERAQILLCSQEYDVAQEDLLPADALTKQTDIVPIRNTKRESLRVYMRILMNLMLVSILPQVLLLSSEIMEKSGFLRNRSHDFIISFIHQKDGEKDN